MSYFESAKGVAISRQRALKELKSHGIMDPTEFYADCGERDSYDAQDVLIWLGY